MTATQSFAVTIFPSKLAKTQERRQMALVQLADLIRDTRAPNKDDLPWLKLARFGTLMSDKGCLRHDNNVIALSGVVVDYDGEKCAIEDAAERLDKAGVEALLYTTASHTETAPRWRVVCRFSTELTPRDHYAMVARLNGLLNGILAEESFTLSQAYYFGSTNGHPPQTIHVHGTQYLDQADVLDEVAIGKANGNGADHRANIKPEASIEDIREALELLPNPVPSWPPNANWTHWNNTVAMPIWRACGGSTDGFVAFEKWSAKSPKYQASVTHERWAHFFKSPPNKATFGGIIHLVRDAIGDPKWLPSSRRRHIELQPTPPADHTPRATEQPLEKPWPVLNDAALHGLAGDVVALILPQTESDKAAILLQFLAAFGSNIGHNAYFRIEATRHYPNLFVCLVGASAKARKGTSWRRVRQLFETREWSKNCIAGGTSTGEGLIYRVRDPVRELKTINKKTGEQKMMIVDHGVDDKRLLVVEEELARPLRAMRRSENTLSSVWRAAWDGSDLELMTKNSPYRATAPHISVVAHITDDEIAAEMDDLSLANGYANRFLFGLIRRSKLLPHGGNIKEDAIAEIADKVEQVIRANLTRGRVKWDAVAYRMWEREYRDNLSIERQKLLGSITHRAEAQTIRLALIYALLDQSALIGEAHLKAALAVWNFCEASARYIFGNKIGDPLADSILTILRAAGETGKSRTDIWQSLPSHNIPGSRIDAALTKLDKLGLVTSTLVKTTRRPATVWLAVA